MTGHNSCVSLWVKCLISNKGGIIFLDCFKVLREWSMLFFFFFNL